MLLKHQRNNIFDGSKLLFTIVMGLMFFFYDVGTIVNPSPSFIKKTTDNIHPSTEQIDTPTTLPTITQDQISTIKSEELSELIQWFDIEQKDYYRERYTKLCEYYSSRCSGIQLQFSDTNNKDYYRWLITLATIDKLNNLLLSESWFENSIIIKDDDSKKRWYATKSGIVINSRNLSSSEFFEVLVHELGHILDLALIQWTSSELHPLFTEFQEPVFAIDDPSLQYYALSRDSEGLKKSGSSIRDFCTIYGSQNPFEDFSECFNLYINHHDYFLSLLPTSKILQSKYDFITLWMRYKDLQIINFSDYNHESDHRYRDSTKISIQKTLEITEL